MKFSLILCTINRVKENEIFLNSLLNQEYKNFEVIIVDQNPDNRILEITSQYKSSLDIKYLKSIPGLSISRNEGIKIATGSVVAFPDDDCIYPKSLLNDISSFISKTSYDGVFVRQVNSLNNGIILKDTKISREYKAVDAFSVGSISIFMKSSAVKRIGDFDTNLGLGASTPFLGGEDAEYIIRGIKRGLRFYHNNELVILHPAVNNDTLTLSPDQQKIYKTRFIGNGAADYYIYKKYFPLAKRIKLIANNSAMMIICLVKNKKKLFLNHVYRIKGFWIAIKHFRSI